MPTRSLSNSQIQHTASDTSHNITYSYSYAILRMNVNHTQENRQARTETMKSHTECYNHINQYPAELIWVSNVRNVLMHVNVVLDTECELWIVEKWNSIIGFHSTTILSGKKIIFNIHFRMKFLFLTIFFWCVPKTATTKKKENVRKKNVVTLEMLWHEWRR